MSSLYQDALDAGLEEIGTANTPYGETLILRGKYTIGAAPLVELVSPFYEWIATLSESIPQLNIRLGRDEFFVKESIHNRLFIPLMLATGLFEDTRESLSIGSIVVHIWRFTQIAGQA